MKDIDITQWTKIGEGGNGATYINDAEPGVLIKESYLELAQADALVSEFNLSKAIFELGVPTPEMIELVSVNGRAAIKCKEIKGKKSFARLCADNPDKIEEYAEKMARLSKEFHGMVVGAGSVIPSKKERMKEAVAVSKMLSEKARKRVMDFVESVEETSTLLHGDFTFSNLIMADDKPYWIDLGNATHGNSFFDLGHFYLFCNIFGRQKRVQEIAHMTDKQMVEFWNRFALVYNGFEGLEEFNRTCQRFAALDIIYLGHVQPLTVSERFFLGMLAKKMIKQ